MSHGPASSTVRAVELGLRLRERREQLGLTAAAVGKMTKIGGNNLSSIEIAKRKLTSAKLAELAGAYELPEAELAELEAMRAEADRREWWHDYARLFPEDFLRYVGLEAGASVIRQYAPETIPGLLQTADYTRAMIRCSVYTRPVDVGPRVEFRLARQARLDGPDAPKQIVVMGQAALRQEVGGREVMADQLRRLAKLAEDRRDRVEIRVMPYNAGAHPLIGSGVSILEFASPMMPTFAWLESAMIGLLTDKQPAVQGLTASFEEVAERALDPDSSLEMIRECQQEMENP